MTTDDRRLRRARAPHRPDREAARLGPRGAAVAAGAAQPARAHPRRASATTSTSSAYADCGTRGALDDLPRLPGADCYQLFGGFEQHELGDVLPDRLPRPLLRPGRLARARARSPPGAARRLLSATTSVSSGSPRHRPRAAREGRGCRREARSAARDPRDRRHRARTCPRTTPPGGLSPLLINEMPRYEILDESLHAGARAWLAPHRQRARRRLRDVRAARADDRRARGGGPEGRGAARQARPRLDPRAGREGAARVRPPGAQPGATTIHVGGKHMAFGAVYGCPFVREGLERREATYADFENLVRLSQSFPQLDTPGGTICEPNDKPLDSRHLDMVYALLTLSDKPFMGSVTSGPNAEDTIAMAEMVFGRESLEANAGDHQPDQRQLAASLRRADAGGAARLREREPGARDHAVPADGRDVAGVGRRRRSRSRSAEALAGIALVQTIRPGCPVVFGIVPLEHRHAVGLAELRHARSLRSACSAPARSRATTGCRSAAAAR